MGRGGEKVTAKEVIKQLESNDWRLKSIEGSHHNFVHPEIKGKITVALHSGDIPTKTLHRILKKAGLK